MNIQQFCNAQSRYLDQEKNAEIAHMSVLQSQYSPKELQKLGYALVGLSVTSIRTGLGGKTLVDFEKDVGGSDLLPPNSFKSGDITSISEYRGSSGTKDKQDSGSNAMTGVVYKVTDQVITLSFSEQLQEFNLPNRCILSKVANNITYQRMHSAIKTLATRKGIENESLIQVLMESRTPAFDSIHLNGISFYDESLNDSQREAVRFALSANHIALIHGPPGTGKTFTCVEVIRQLIKRGDRVLVCGPSNLAVDNLVERLAKCKLDLLRIGHPARILPCILDHALDIRIKTCEEGQIVSDCRRELDKTLSLLHKAKRSERKALYQDIKHLKNELRVREKTVVANLIKNAHVILSTLNGSASRTLENEEFDTILIDEGSQALEAECWIAILKGKRVIIAGDPMQLPPTIKSSKNGKSPLEVTLMDRMLKKHGNSIKRLLNTQYRMNEFIMNFSSKQFYNNELIAHESVKDRLLTDLPNVIATEETHSPLMLIDTVGSDFRESIQDSKHTLSLDESKFNQGEADLVIKHVKYLYQNGVAPDDIAIISPYSAQVGLLKLALKDEFPKIEIGTVDGFQGREKQVVILSLVRNNDEHEVGFLAESRRLNVALTRAKSHLVVVCNGEFMSESRDSVLKKMMEYFEEFAFIEYSN